MSADPAWSINHSMIAKDLVIDDANDMGLAGAHDLDVNQVQAGMPLPAPLQRMQDPAQMHFQVGRGGDERQLRQQEDSRMLTAIKASLDAMLNSLKHRLDPSTFAKVQELVDNVQQHKVSLTRAQASSRLQPALSKPCKPTLAFSL